MTNLEDTTKSGAPDRFATGFSSLTGELFVYGALFMAGICVLAVLLRGQPGFFAGALAGLMSAFYFYPFIDTKNAQLGADARGLYVGGLGMIGWRAIEDFQIVRTAVRTVEKAELRVRLNTPLQEALVMQDEVSWWRRLMARNWWVKGNDEVTVRLEHLRSTPDEIEAEINRLSRA